MTGCESDVSGVKAFGVGKRERWCDGVSDDVKALYVGE